MKVVKSYGFFIVLGLLLTCSSLLVNRFHSYTLPELAENTGKTLDQKLNAASGYLQELTQAFDPQNWEKERFYTAFDEERIGLYLYNGKKLEFWNNAHIPVFDSLLPKNKQRGLIVLKQGYYLFEKYNKGNRTAYALCLVRSKYDLQNNHLKNAFPRWTGIPREIEFSEKTGTPADVKLAGESLFSLRGNDGESYNNSRYNLLCLVLFFTGISIFFVSLLGFFSKKNSWLNAVLVILPLVIVKSFMLSGYVPSFLATTFLYDMRVFANAQSDMNGTLSDILFNGAALLFVALILFFSPREHKNTSSKIIHTVLLFVVVFFAVWQFNHSIKSLVYNSVLSYDFLNVFNIKIAAVVSLLAFVFNSVTLFVLLYRASSFFSKNWWPAFFGFTICNLAVCLAVYFVNQLLHSPMQTIFQDYWLLVFSSTLFVLVRFRYQKASLALGLLVAVMSVTTSVFFTYYITKNQKDNLKVFADKLSEKQDVYLENEFAEIPEKIKKDNNLSTLIDILPVTKKEINELLKQRYFKGYFNTYNVDISMFDKDCKPLLNPALPVLMNEGFFEDQIKFYSDSTLSPELFFVQAYKKNSRYIGKIKVGEYNLYFLLERKQFEEQGSFPELLLDQSQQKDEKLRSFSHVVYRSGQKTSSLGDFNYPPYFSDSLTLTRLNPGYVHTYFSPDESTQIIFSERATGWRYFFTYNSYLFLFFSIVSFILYSIYALFFTSSFRSASLTRRIQSIIIFLLLLAMSAVGITSGNLVTKQFETDNIKQLQEKTQTILSELREQFKNDELFSSAQKESVNARLQEFAKLYNSDISLFDSSGVLFDSSQPKLYELGLAASISNPKAFFSLKENEGSMVNVTEKAGSLSYLSLYTPVFDENKNILGFINLPYFARQSDLTNELSNIISALINVYVILFVISILAGLILAGYITKPLRLIQQQISNITLGKQNESLKWQSNDEVGKLVTEYNNMLLKLEQSANLLAQSERESAWREMAKQVAHEIKNPLTPMKLNLQYLQHVMKNNPDDFKEKFERASASIIEQIDALAGIATEFSNFAKLPGTQLQEINLLEIIHSSVNIFELEGNVNITVDVPFSEMNVMGDKEQALRVFNNVIKNAIQATQEVEHAFVKITAEESSETYTIKIEDNGCGIPEEMKEKIFTPNFTTKSTGSGLGLAMVKNIVNGFGGKIWFVSEKEKGSSFFIEFRKA